MQEEAETQACKEAKVEREMTDTLIGMKDTLIEMEETGAETAATLEKD